MENPLGCGGVIELGHVLLPDERILDGHPGPGVGPRPCLSADVHTANTVRNDIDCIHPFYQMIQLSIYLNRHVKYA